MNRSSILALVVSTLLLFGISSLAHATYPIWTHIASASVVDEADLSEYTASAAAVCINSAAVRPNYVYLRTNIASPRDDGLVSPNWNCLTVKYQDPDGTTTGNAVTVYLRKIDCTTAAPVTIATFNSNSFTDTGVICHSKTFTEAWDFCKYFYYLETRLYRSSTATTVPCVHAFRLSNSQDQCCPTFAGVESSSEDQGDDQGLDKE